MGGLRAVWGAAVRGRNSGGVEAISWEEVIAATLGDRISIDGGEAIRPPKPSGGAGARPEVSGWPWPTSAVCGEYARKLLWARRCGWSQAWRLGTVNPSRKLRRFESFTCHHVLKGPLTCGNAGRGPLLVPGGGIESGSFLAIFTALGRRPVTCANAEERTGGVEVRAEYVRKFGPRRRAGRTRPHADLWGCLGWGYAIVKDVRTIAIGSGGVGRPARLACRPIGTCPVQGHTSSKRPGHDPSSFGGLSDNEAR